MNSANTKALEWHVWHETGQNFVLFTVVEKGKIIDILVKMTTFYCCIEKNPYFCSALEHCERGQLVPFFILCVENGAKGSRKTG